MQKFAGQKKKVTPITDKSLNTSELDRSRNAKKQNELDKTKGSSNMNNSSLIGLGVGASLNNPLEGKTQGESEYNPYKQGN